MVAWTYLWSFLLSSSVYVSANSDVEPWFMSALKGLSTNPVEARNQGLERFTELIKSYDKVNPLGEPSEYPYFNVFPQFKGAAKKDAAPVSWSSRCFTSNSAVATVRTSNSWTVTVTTTGSPVSEGCEDNYLFMTVTGARYITIDQAGSMDVIWSIPSEATDAEKWDIDNKGVRVFNFLTEEKVTIANLMQTILLFIPEFTKPVDPASAKRNVDFMARYPQFTMESRDPASNLPPMEHEVKSGDFFGVIRLDGLDPMLAWAMGSTTGHTVTALWMDGELYIAESTVTDSYWPTNGIQKTPYRKWLKQAEEAGYNVAWAPLNKQYRAKFNETAAVAFFKENEGLDYGYRNMLYGWIDTLKSNYPCLPPDYSSNCFQWELVEPLFGILDTLAPELVDLFINQAFNLRLGTSNLRLAEIFQTAGERGMESREIPVIVEQDAWMYQTTRNGEPAVGRSMVCCVFVCSTLKAAGIFGDDEVNCGEFTNADDYGMALFDSEYKQIIGRWTLDFNHYNIKKPYSHMAESCSSLPPLYEQAVDC